MKFILVPFLSFVLFAGCGQDASKATGPQRVLSTPDFDRTDLPAVEPESLFGKDGTYELETVRAVFDRHSTVEGSDSHAKVSVQLDPTGPTLQLLTKEVTGEPTPLNESVEVFTSMDARTGESRSQLAVDFELNGEEFTYEMLPGRSRENFLSNLKSAESREQTRFYQRPDQGVVMVAKANEKTRRYTEDFLIEITYRFVPRTTRN